MERVVTSCSGVAPPLPPKTRRSFAKSSPTVSLIETTTTTPPAMLSATVTRDSRFTSFAIQDSKQQSQIVSPAGDNRHVVKIRITPGEDVSFDNPFAEKVHVVHQPQSLPLYTNNSSCIRININNNNNHHNNNNDNNNEENMIRTEGYMKERPSPYFFCGAFPTSATGLISSGQSSPSDTLDSGTCSDLDGSTPPPLPKPSPTTVTVIVNGDSTTTTSGHHKRNCSLASSGIDVDSDDEGSNISCDSLNGHELSVARLRELDNIEEPDQPESSPEPELEKEEVVAVHSPPPPPAPAPVPVKIHGLPHGLLQDIRERSSKLNPPPPPVIAKTWAKEPTAIVAETVVVETFPAPPRRQETPPLLARVVSPTLSREDATSPKPGLVNERTYEDRTKEAADREKQLQWNNANNAISNNYDRFYTFHLNENVFAPEVERPVVEQEPEETFAGVRNYLEASSTTATIRSAKGTVRGVKNRVRAGIATFLQMNADKGYKEKEAGKVVLYTTTMGVVRATFHECLKVKQILRTLMVKFEERDVFMSREVQTEIRERLESDHVELPQLFVEGQHIGDAETVERLNETGELRKMLKPFKSADACMTCAVCGGYHLLPCPMCNGSKKSVHRNDFTAGFVALKCMNCDEVGLVRCHAC